MAEVNFWLHVYGTKNDIRIEKAEHAAGHWVESECGVFCSECGRPTDDRHDEIREFEGKTVIALCLPKYCGFCGAYMRGES